MAIAVRDFLPCNMTGKVRLNVLVGADDLAKSLNIVGSPPKEFADYLAKAAMAQRYKPAMCRGKPCEMIYPINYLFTNAR